MSTMPVVFIGHGSPMNAVEDNAETRGWRALAAELPAPRAILAVSAHWYTRGTRVCDAQRPRTIHDMSGFPAELYEIEYGAPGAPELAKRILELVPEAAVDGTWGIDHGTWSVLRVMYPEAAIPVVQLSVDEDAPPQRHYETGRKLASLRDEGVLVLGSGNVVHNLSMVDFAARGGFDWAYEFDGYLRDRIARRDDAGVVDYHRSRRSARLAVPTPEHFLPLLTVLGAARADEGFRTFNEVCVMGSLSMTCYVAG
jgi:4,5-DOPA dioxygenase extradiol